MRFLSRCLALFVLSAVASQATIGVGLQMQLGNPSGATTDPANKPNFLLDRAQLAIGYNDGTRDPNWVSWNLTSPDVGTVDRSDFVPDPDLPAGFYAVTTQDYNGVGNIRYDRGHMSPSKDRTVTEADNQVVFYMTNIAPQAADNNQGPWEAFETECRNIAAQGNELLIVCGPSGFTSATIPSGVAFIPAFVWKIVVVVPNGPGSALSRINANTRVIALKLPNVNGIRSVPWTDYITSASEIETDTGYNFFQQLPADVAAALRTKVDGGGTTPSGVPVILTQPAPQAAVIGGSATFSVAASGGTLIYQWQREGEEIIGATNPTLTLNNLQPADAGNYNVIVTNSVGSTVSAAATLTVSAPQAPEFTTPPAPKTVLAGSNATFTAAASGVPTPTLQWFRAGTLLASGTSFTIINAQATDAGTYTVVATNLAGSVSADTNLAVTPVPPTITTQPVSQSVAVGGSVTLSVVASGSAPFTYQWRKNGTTLAGATDVSFTITNAQNADAGSYDVLVTNAASSAASALAVVSLTPPGVGTVVWDFNSGTTLPVPPTTIPASFAVTPGALSTGNPFNTTAINATSASPTSPPLSLSGGNNLANTTRVGPLNQAASGSAYFEFTLTPASGTRVVPTALTFGSRSTGTGPQAFSVFTNLDGFATAVGSGTLTNNSSWSVRAPTLPVIAGAIDTPITFRVYGHSGTGNAVANNGNWRIDDVKVTAYATSGGPVAPTIAVTSTSPAANAQNVSVTSPITITFNVPVTVTGEWFALTGNAGAIAATVTADASGAAYTLTPTSSFANNDTLNVTVFGSQVSTASATLGANYTFTFQTAPPTAPAITTQPRAVTTVVAGGSTSLTVVATGTAPLSYLWRKDGVALQDEPGHTAGATSPTLSLSNLILGDTGIYTVVITNPANAPVTSADARLTVTATPVAPSILTPPVAQTVSLGATATFSVVADGSSPLQFQWRHNGVALSNNTTISGADTDTLVLSSVTLAQAGDYDVVVSNGTPPHATSPSARLTIHSAAGLSFASFTGGYYIQDFNTLPSSGTFAPAGSGPFDLSASAANGGAGASGLPGWSYARYSGSGSAARFGVDTGSGTAGSVYAYGSSGAADRALGSLASGSAVSRVGLMLVNNTGAPITQLTVRFVSEHWRHGGSTTPSKLSFGYAVGATDINTGTFTTVPSLDARSSVTTEQSGALNGNQPSNRQSVLAQLTDLTWPAGEVLVLRWTDVDDSGADDGLALDDFVLTTESLVAPTIAQHPANQNVTAGDSVTFQVVANGTPTPTYQWRKDNTPIAAATNATLTFATVTTADAGVYTCVVSNPAGDVTSNPATLTVAKAPATITIGNTLATYDGTPHAVTTTTSPAGLSVAVTYDSGAGPVATAPLAAGTYNVVATITDPNYTGSAAAALTILKQPANVALGNLNHVYDGTPKSATATSTPAGLDVVLTYNGAATPPTQAGSYAVVATIDDPNRTGSATGTLVIAKAPALIALSNLTQPYDGTPRIVTVTTTPADLSVDVTYNGSAIAPVYPGSYDVIATLQNANYIATMHATLEVTVTALVRHAPVFNADVDGSVQVLLPESVTLNSGALVSGDLLMPGTPALRLNGQPVFVGTRDGPGAATPTNHQVTLNSGAVLRYLVRRVNAITLPVAPPPAAPTGTRNVTINSGQPATIGDPATLRNLTLNGNVGAVAVPPGTYGSFIANGASALVFGVDGASAPVVYNLQNLTLNSGSRLHIVGPVVLNLAHGTVLNGAVGTTDRAEWLTLNVAAGGVTLNNNVSFHGRIIAPNGTVTLNGNVILVGRVAADRLILNGNATLRDDAP